MANKLPMAIFLAISVFFILPIFFLVRGSISTSFKGEAFTLTFLIQALTSRNLWSLLTNTLEYGLISAAIAVGLATIYAWLMARTDTPGKTFLRLLPLFPLTIPQVVKAFAWIFLFSPKIGLVNSSLESIFGITTPLFNIFSMTGLIFANAAGGIPLAYLMIEASLQSMDPSLEDASRATGAGALRTFGRVVIPILRPAIIAVFLLEALIGVESFDYPFIIGRNQIPTLATQVYNLVNVSGNFGLAAATSDIYLIITIALIGLYLYYIRKSFRFVTVTGKATVQTLFKLGKWKWAGFAFCVGAMLVSFILPIGILVAVSLVPHYTVAPGYNTFGVLTLVNYVNAFKVSLFWTATANSFVLSIGTAVIATLIATVMGYVLVKGRSRFTGVLQYFSLLPLAFPGVVLSIGLIWTFLSIPGLSGLYGTVYVVLIALVVVWLPYSIRFMSNSLVQISDELEEAATVSGSSWIRKFTKVTFPLLKNGVRNSLVYIMSDSFRELGAVVLLTNSSSLTLTVLILDLYQNTAGAFPVISALSIIMVLFISILIIIPRILIREKNRTMS